MAKTKKQKKIIQWLSTMLVLVFILIGSYDWGVNEFTSSDSEVSVHFIDVGQADSILITSEGHHMLIDAGNNEDADLIISYLKEQGVTELDYVIGTHPHEDHIGALDTVINTFKINTLIMPEKIHTTKTFEDVVTAVENRDYSITAPKIGLKYQIGNAEFVVIAPNDTYGEELNDWSVGIKLTSGKNSFLFCGDAEIEAEKDILANGIDISADVYKVSHHGSDTSTSVEFLDTIAPKYAVISVGKDNHYGHPDKKILNRLEDAGIEIYRTDEMGTIVASSDGKNITWTFRK